VEVQGIQEISNEEGNGHFCVNGHFLLDITGTSFIAFFGIAATVTISCEIQVLCDSCFLGCKTLSKLTFEDDSQLHRIERLAFGECSSLHTIRIPSSIQSLEREWFLNSHFHGGVVFDIVRFDNAEPLLNMIEGNCIDLSGDFCIEIDNCPGETVIPGYYVDTVFSGNFVRLKKLSESVNCGSDL
jgi:hypothetical protein